MKRIILFAIVLFSLPVFCQPKPTRTLTQRTLVEATTAAVIVEATTAVPCGDDGDGTGDCLQRDWQAQNAVEEQVSQLWTTFTQAATTKADIIIKITVRNHATLEFSVYDAATNRTLWQDIRLVVALDNDTVREVIIFLNYRDSLFTSNERTAREAARQQAKAEESRKKQQLEAERVAYEAKALHDANFLRTVNACVDAHRNAFRAVLVGYQYVTPRTVFDTARGIHDEDVKVSASYCQERWNKKKQRMDFFNLSCRSIPEYSTFDESKTQSECMDAVRATEAK